MVYSKYKCKYCNRYYNRSYIFSTLNKGFYCDICTDFICSTCLREDKIVLEHFTHLIKCRL